MPINPIPKKNEEQMGKPQRVNSFFISEPLYFLDDIILSSNTLEEIKCVISYFNNKSLIFDKWGLGKVYHKSNSMCVNLYGKPGTGKTMAAHAIAAALEMKLLIVNYAEIESKYVGETSKNLVSLFDFAKREKVIILFDEADALLSKRVTAMSSSTDVSVNQTRNVLLKLLDEYDGIILFTTNFFSNYDQAFIRRILFHIPFDLPNEEERRRLWEHYLVEEFPIIGERSEIISELGRYEDVSGSDISNAVLKTAIKLSQRKFEGAMVTDIIAELDKIKYSSSIQDGDKYEITSRKVSKEYVQEKLMKGNE